MKARHRSTQSRLLILFFVVGALLCFTTPAHADPNRPAPTKERKEERFEFEKKNPQMSDIFQWIVKHTNRPITNTFITFDIIRLPESPDNKYTIREVLDALNKETMKIGYRLELQANGVYDLMKWNPFPA